ncbi:MAG: DUF4835 family protein [Lewinellaceae bacterium]|nr:DUF4835 family protein [Lewinellaceae bacterium]
MKFIPRFFPLFSLLLSAWSLSAQGELNCTVRISTPQLQNTDRKVFDKLEVALRDFLNTNKWTNDQFEPDERIKCNFILTISTEMDNNTFNGELAVQAVRPVFGSGYETPLLSHLDKDVTFSYEQNQPIEFLRDAADNQNLAAVLFLCQPDTGNGLRFLFPLRRRPLLPDGSNPRHQYSKLEHQQK